MKKIVCIGGGNGLSIVLEGLKKYTDSFSLSAIVSVADSGSASGKLREELGVLPPGDLLRTIIALSSYDSILLKKVLYDTRYSGEGKLQGFGMGHIFMALAQKYSGNAVDTISFLSSAVGAVGTVLPSSTSQLNLCAEMEDGSVLKGEHAIDRPENKIKILRCFLDPVAEAYPKACEYITDADIIIIGPGSLHTSLVAALLPKGIKEAIGKSTAKIIFVSSNGVEKEGEWCPDYLSETIDILEKYLPRQIDIIISNTTNLTVEQQQYYNIKKWSKILDDVNNIKNKIVVSKSFDLPSGGMDAVRLGEILYPLM